jgi:hypothetical protein
MSCSLLLVCRMMACMSLVSSIWSLLACWSEHTTSRLAHSIHSAQLRLKLQQQGSTEAQTASEHLPTVLTSMRSAARRSSTQTCLVSANQRYCLQFKACKQLHINLVKSTELSYVANLLLYIRSYLLDQQHQTS